MQKGGTSPDKHLQGRATLPHVIHSLPGTGAKLLTPTCERPSSQRLPAAAHAWSTSIHTHICSPHQRGHAGTWAHHWMFVFHIKPASAELSVELHFMACGDVELSAIFSNLHTQSTGMSCVVLLHCACTVHECVSWMRALHLSLWHIPLHSEQLAVMVILFV